MANIGYIQITRECNQNCRFCSNPPTGIDLTFEEGRKIIEGFAADSAFAGVLISGGEPTVSELLPELISCCASFELPCTIVTNGQRIADINYLKRLRNAGLRHIILSLYSVRPEIQNFLADNPDSHANIMKALSNLSALGDIRVDMSSVINKYNSDHLLENVLFAVKEHAYINHFIWNGLDPVMNRASENPDTVPLLNDFQLELSMSIDLLSRQGKTFRISRTPLCYMSGFEYASTETRKIVKNEERTIYFLDDKGKTQQKEFTYGKCEKCGYCTLDSICAGLYSMDKHYFSKELYPVFLTETERNAIVEKIRSEA